MYLGNTRSIVRPDKGCPACCGDRARLNYPALNAVGGRVFQRKTRARGTRVAPGPRRGGMLVLRVWEVRMGARRSRTPMGGPRPRLLVRSFPSSGTRGVTGPVPERGAGPGPLAR